MTANTGIKIDYGMSTSWMLAVICRRGMVAATWVISAQRPLFLPTRVIVELQFVVIVKTHTRLKWYCNQLNKNDILYSQNTGEWLMIVFSFPKPPPTHTGQEHLQTPHLVRQINSWLISNKKSSLSTFSQEWKTFDGVGIKISNLIPTSHKAS